MARAGPNKSKGKEKPKRLTPAEQHSRFVEAAEKAEADEAPDALDKAFRGLNVRSKNSIRKPDSNGH
jgi:hypothetical protein